MELLIQFDPIWAVRTCTSYGCPIVSDQFGFGGGAQGTLGTPKNALYLTCGVFLSTMMLLRLLCLVPLAVILPGESAMPGCLFHSCTFHRGWNFVNGERADRPSGN